MLVTNRTVKTGLVIHMYLSQFEVILYLLFCVLTWFLWLSVEECCEFSQHKLDLITLLPSITNQHLLPVFHPISQFIKLLVSP